MFRTFREFAVPRRLRGFSLVTALFLLIVLAGLGVFVVTVSGLQQTSQALDVDGARAYAAAQAGIEWGLHRVLDPGDADPGLAAMPPQPPGCFATTAVPLGSEFAGLSLNVACSAATTTEVNRNLVVYTITATAVAGTGTAYATKRVVTATVSRCTDPNGASPRYGCS
jgi:MSHA biogenesis protein MshP